MIPVEAGRAWRPPGSYGARTVSPEHGAAGSRSDRIPAVSAAGNRAQADGSGRGRLQRRRLPFGDVESWGRVVAPWSTPEAEKPNQKTALGHRDELPDRNKSRQAEPVATPSKNGAEHWILLVAK